MKKVRCIETGLVYDSVNEAAAAIGRNKSSLSLAIKNKSTCGSYHWCFAIDELIDFTNNIYYNNNTKKVKDNQEKQMQKKTIYVSEEVHTMLKAICQFKGVTMSQYVDELLLENLQEPYERVLGALAHLKEEER